MASGSPRKRRMGRLFDKMYGDDTRGSHQGSQMYASRSVAQQASDLDSYRSAGKASFLTASMDLSSSAANKRHVKIDAVADTMYNNGSGSYGFACWLKMASASAPVPVSAFSFGGDATAAKFFSFGLEASGSGYQVQTLHNSGSGANVTTSMSALSFSAGTWQFLSYTENRVGTSRHYTASLNAAAFTSGTLTPFPATFNSCSLGIVRSGSLPGDGVNNMVGRVHQAAFWNALKTNDEFKTIYNSGVSDNWKKHNPTEYWALGVSDGTTVDSMSGSVAGTVVSGTLRADAP